MVSIKQLNESLNRLYEDYEINEDWQDDAEYEGFIIKPYGRKYLGQIDLEDNTGCILADQNNIFCRTFDSLENAKHSLDNIADMLLSGYTKEDIENAIYNGDIEISESLTEARNPENDEVNDVIRRNIGKRLKDISPEDRELLANNDVSISGGKDNRTYSIKDNRSMTFDKNGRTKEYSTHGLRKPSQPDVNNPDFDLKGWLSTDAKRVYGAQYKPSNEYKRLKSYADDAEKRGRRYRKDLEAQVQNSMLDNDDYYPRVDYESRDRAIRGDYEWADRLNDRAKKVASDAKARSKYYKNESLNESVVTFNSSAKYTEFIDAIGDIQNWIEDYEIDLQDVLYDVFNHSPGSNFGEFIINLRNEYRDEE